MSRALAIRARSLSKSYGDAGSLRWVLGLGRDGDPQGAALDDVSFEVPGGCALAVIGANGAGKSTLLRLLAGRARPTRGSLEIVGRVGALLDLGAGFIEEMTGRENAGALLALDWDRRGRGPRDLDAVLSFAGLGRFAEEPVRTYSQGMRLRLAYAVEAAALPDVLIADEVLAVGDEEFQRKCTEHLLSFLAGGGTLVLATHNLYHAEKVCQQGLWLNGGKVVARGAVRQVTAAYRAEIERRQERWETRSAGRYGAGADPGDIAGGGRRFRLEFSIEGSWDPRATGSVAGMRVAIEPAPHGAEPMHLEIQRPNGVVVASFAVRGERITMESVPLLPGHYRLTLVRLGGEILAEADFEWLGASREIGPIRLKHEWI